ncbi:metallophosphoesterase family protein [Sphingorhabdus contaminans]|uniref:metallophosphoesterase family protein n=1 Tax=Sphingorhabdus contaminans TaxID=1343899 RepID=UPI003D29BAF3
MRIAVISDIHSAYAPFATALSDARTIGFDQLILLGDLFTYGLDPKACAELAAEAIARDGALLVGGNHDQLYIDMENGETGYFDRMPEWIKQSAEWTWAQLGSHWPDNLPMVD